MRVLDGRADTTERTDMTVIGIDPGKTGGVAVITDREPTLYPMEMCKQVLQMIPGVVYIEKQTALSGQRGVAQTMQAYGEIIGYAEATGHTVKIITPQEWYRYFGTKAGMPKKQRKEDTAEKMKNLYPSVSHSLYGPRGGLLDGLSDALAIAHYGWRKEC